ncbi:Alpha/Beta hydrolase protein [Lipomyces kononenkoae]|uniref:Alpha/Beta hydrolase protein n=1 Tax=Lipomyces kononenkoae TaxID=34357 RepID=A0ACC3SQX8_LIPKO
MSINNRPLTTPEVPQQFLEAVYLVGHIPQRALATDPRVSYALYVPPQHYNPDPNGSSSGNNHLARLPLLVYLHSTRRNISPIHNELVPFAQSTPCAILAPLFPSNIDGPNDLDSYKVLRSSTLRSDLALLSILGEIAQCWPGIETNKVFLMGFSGGGQFAHRFLYLYPERLAAVSVGAPGHVTMLDDSQSWPRGVADAESLFNRTIQKDLIKQPRIQLVVGSEDVNVHGGKEFAEWLKKLKARRNHHERDRAGDKDKDELPSMEHGRLDTLRRLHTLWKQDGIEAQLDVVEGVAHVAGGVRKRVLAFLQPLMQNLDH